jgi:PAS domain S-box-containing protein
MWGWMDEASSKNFGGVTPAESNPSRPEQATQGIAIPRDTLQPNGAADLIERSQVKAAVRDSEERARQLAAIVDSSDDSIVGTDLKRRITSWNRGAERLFGYTAKEAVGMPIAAIIPEERHVEELAIFERFQCGERIEPFDTVRRHKDGGLIDVSLSVSPIRNLDGQIVGACSVTRDITERKRTEKRVAMLAREAEHRTKNVLQAVQTVVHLSQAQTPEELKRVIEGRIQALANAHGLLAETRWVGADLAKLVRQELAPYLEQERPRARIEGPHVPVRPSVAQAIAVMLHELTTNAAKHGALSVVDGHVEIEWVRLSDDRLLLIWTETGGPAIAAPIRRGFGTYVMDTLIKLDLGGELRLDWRAEGLVYEIEFQI